MPNNNKRPVFLDLTRIHLPVTAVLSIGHRISGVLMVLMVPLIAYLFDLSLSGEEGFAATVALFSDDPFQMIAVIGVWVFTHHFLAGIRFLLLDIDVGVDLRSARISAWTAVAGAIVTMFVAVFVVL